MTDGADEETLARIFGPAHRRLTIGMLAAIAFIAFEATAVATAMPTAVPALNGMPLYPFAFSAFFTTSLFAMVISGEICDRRGPKLPLVVGAAAFAAGLTAAGAAQSMWPFLAGRAVQGLGGGLVIVALYVVVGRAYPDRLRPRVFAAMSSAWVVPSIVGPVAAGLLTDHLTWRLAFLGVVPLIIVPLVLALPSVDMVDGPAAGRVAGDGARGRRRIAWFALATALGVGLLQYAGARLDLVAIGVAVGALALLAASLPRLLPAGALRLRRGLPTVVVLRGILAGSFFGAEAFLPLLLVTERGLSSTLAGLSLTGAALGWTSGSWYQGRSRIVTPRHLLVRVGFLLIAASISALGLALVPAVPVVVPALIWTAGAFGMGIAMASVSVLLFRLSPVSEQGANSAALQVCDALFSAMFVGLAGAIFGAAHSTTPEGGGAPDSVYLVILAVMAALALSGAWAAGRVKTT